MSRAPGREAQKVSTARPTEDDLLTIGALAERSGVAPSALRFYESQGLIQSSRTEGGQRRYEREVLRRVSFIRIAQQLDVSLEEIRRSMASLPDDRTPTKADWQRLAKSWRQRLDDRITTLEQLRDNLGDCIGCGCLSLKVCALYNAHDAAASFGAGPRYLLGNSADDIDLLKAADAAGDVEVSKFI